MTSRCTRSLFLRSCSEICWSLAKQMLDCGNRWAARNAHSSFTIPAWVHRVFVEHRPFDCRQCFIPPLRPSSQRLCFPTKHSLTAIKRGGGYTRSWSKPTPSSPARCTYRLAQVFFGGYMICLLHKLIHLGDCIWTLNMPLLTAIFSPQDPSNTVYIQCIFLEPLI